MLPTKLRSGGRRGRDRLAAVDRQDDHVGGGFDLLALVEVLALLVAGEVDDAVAELARLPPIEKSTALPRPPPQQHARSSCSGSSVARAGRAHHDDRLARLAGPSRGGSSRRSRARSSRAGPCSAVDPGAGQRAAARSAAGRRRSRGAWPSKFCRRKNWPGWKFRAAAGARTTTSTIVGVRRSTRDDARRQVVLEAARGRRPTSRVGAPRRGAAARRANSAAIAR